MNLDEIIDAQLAGTTVFAAALASFDFASGFKRFWVGFGTLVTADGQSWEGVNNMARLSPIRSGSGQAVEEITVSLFGGDEILTHIAEDLEETRGREFRLYRQYFATDFSTLLGDPQHVFRGRMSAPKVEWSPARPGETPVRTVAIRAQSPLVNRRRPANAFWSDRDQQARHPGDQICIAMSGAKIKVPWPSF